MKFVDPPRGSRMPTLELTRRNALALLAKLDDPLSVRSLIAPGGGIAVRAVEDGRATYVENTIPPTVELTRRNLTYLLARLDADEHYKAVVDADWRIVVTAVEDDVHYADREPGEVFMPSIGETI